MKTAYLLERKLSWKTFQNVWGKFPSGDIVAENLPRMIWELMRNKQVYVTIDPSQEDDPLCISLKPPKGTTKLIKNKNK